MNQARTGHQRSPHHEPSHLKAKAEAMLAPRVPSTLFTEVQATPTDAIKLVRSLRRGRQFFIMVHNMAPILNTPDKAFPTCASVKIVHGAAAKYITDAYANFEARGALVPISYSASSLFIG